MIKNYRELIVWQKSIDFVKQCYELTKLFPRSERYGLCSQLQRAAVSVPANIAEGFHRQYTKEYIQFLSIAKGSLAEVETYFAISEKLNFIIPEKTDELFQLSTEIGKMLSATISTLKKRV